MSVAIRPVAITDKTRWDQLYTAYATFYEVDQTDQMRAQVWDWLMDPDQKIWGLVAERDGVVIGLAHYRQFARPLAAATGGYLDDLFVDPAARGSGAADALIAGVKAEGAAHGWGIIRWITAKDNARARAVYDRTAQATPWVTYDLEV